MNTHSVGYVIHFYPYKILEIILIYENMLYDRQNVMFNKQSYF